jgi:hypothetical protein
MLRASASLILTSTCIVIIIIIRSSILQRILKTQIDLHHHPSIGQSSSGINPSLLLFLVVGYCWCYAHSQSVQQHSKAWYKLKGRGHEMQDSYGVVNKLFSSECSRRRGRSSSRRTRTRTSISSSKRRSKNSRRSSSSRRSKKENKYRMVFAHSCRLDVRDG